jgi:ATP-binding cassette, subfamily B, multidrug efflux pump
LKSLAHLNKYFIKYKWYLILGFIFTVVSNMFGIWPAQLVRYALDLVRETLDIYFLFGGSRLQAQLYETFTFTILLYGLLILGMALLKGVFLFLVRQTLIVMSRHIEYDLKNEVYNHYQSLPLSFYRRNNTGDLMARISEDVSKVRMHVGPSIMYGLNLITVFIMVISYMVTVNARLTIFVLLPLPLLSVSLYVVSRIIQKRSEALQSQLSELSTYVQESFSGIRVIKAFVREREQVRNFIKASNDYKDRSLKLNMVDALFYPFVAILIGLSNVLIIYIGGQEIIAGRLTPGNITEFIIYVNMLTWPVMALGWTTSQSQRAATSMQRIKEFLNIKSEIVSDKNIEKDIIGSVSFQNIDFVYPDSGIHALKNFNLTIKPGQTVAILGTTGSGKSTVANLLMRLYDPTNGQITIDKTPLKDYRPAFIRSQMGYVPQDVFLFSDSIANNVRFGQENISFAHIEQATRDADLYANITEFPDSFDTTLGERGITLSGGQKQRLSIARAIVREPKILILDDCLSAVDTQTENTILGNLQRIMANRTSVIISHRVSSAKLSDFIVFLDNGQIMEQGTHQELMAQNGLYQSLYDKQTQTEDAY